MADSKMNLPNHWQQNNGDLPAVDDPQRALCRATRCLKGEIAEYVLLPGDPGRAAMIAENWFDDGKLVMANREFHSYTGTYKGVAMSVISTGLGSPGAAMVVQDLPKLGVKAAIRVGTAGSATESVQPGHLVIGNAAVRDEGVSHNFIPAAYPAVADPQLVQRLQQAAAKTEATVHTGIVHTSDAFSSPGLAEQQKQYGDAGILAFEMEAAAVLVLASLNKVAAACILSIDGYVSNVASGNTVPDKQARDLGTAKAITIALEALLDLAASETVA